MTSNTAASCGAVVPHELRMQSELDLNDLDCIKSLSAQETVDYVQSIFTKLQQKVPGCTDMTSRDFMERISNMLGFRFDEPTSLDKIDNYLCYNATEIMNLHRQLAHHKFFEPDAARQLPSFPVADILDQYRSVVSIIYSFNRALCTWGRCKLTVEDFENCTGFRASSLGSVVGEPAVCFQFDDEVKLGDHQHLVLFLLGMAYDQGLRKYGDHVYERIVIEQGQEQLLTHAWQPKMELEKFVRTSCRKEVHFNFWKAANARACSVADAAKYLKTCVDPELPTLQKDRHVFAFQDGTYVLWVEQGGVPSDLFVPYRLGPGEKPLHSGVVAANFFEQPMGFRKDTHWSDIPTPNLDKIMDTQDFAPEVKRWMYVMLGRLLYDLGERDAWQVIPFLKGVGGCGKSTLINDVCGQFYQKEDIGVLSNNCERRFGLSALVGKFVFVAPEIKEDMQLEQSEFQSIVTGEELQINKKHETAFAVQWTTPGIMAGNELPGWTDNAGSIARRILIFYFGNHVPAEKGDTELKSKLHSEIGCILQKCNRAYIEAVQQVGGSNVWLYLPQYFAEQQQQLRMETNSLEHFLGHGTCVFGTSEYIPRDDFVQTYQRYCKDNNLIQRRVMHPSNDPTFARYGIKVAPERADRVYPRGSSTVINANFMLGVDVRSSAATTAGLGADDDDGF